MSLEYFNFPENKDLNDFKEVSNNLRNEKQVSRADAVDYLIERCKRAESKILLLQKFL